MSLVSTEGFADLVSRTGMSYSQIGQLIGRDDRTVRRYVNGDAKRIDRLVWEKVREAANAQCRERPQATFTFIDLFAGIGGLRRPFEEIGGRCVFTSEWDRFARETYAANFPEPADSDHMFEGDIRPFAENPERVPAHDVLLYSMNENAATNGFNEAVSVETDEQSLFMKPMGMGHLHRGVREDAKLTPEGVSELFWSILMEPLQRSR